MIKFRSALVYAFVVPASFFLALQNLTAQRFAGPVQPPVQSELAIEGGSSVGNIQIFAYAEGRRINPIGFEYDRHSWGGFLGARLDYAAELLPALLLTGPAKYNVHSQPLTTEQSTQYGTGFSPAGARLLWRRDRRFKPYLFGKGGVAYFEDRALSTEGTHLNFTAQFGGGVEERLSGRWDLRTGFGDFHLSNGDIARHNPGVDCLGFNASLGYRFGW
jgi:hypothetical protein